MSNAPYDSIIKETISCSLISVYTWTTEPRPTYGYVFAKQGTPTMNAVAQPVHRTSCAPNCCSSNSDGRHLTTKPRHFLKQTSMQSFNGCLSMSNEVAWQGYRPAGGPVKMRDCTVCSTTGLRMFHA